MDLLSPVSPRRNTSFESLRLEPLSRSLTISNDGYDYTDAGVAPEDVPTTGRQAGRPEKTDPPIGNTKPLTSSRRMPDGTLRLLTRRIDGGWRPKVPDEESAMVEPTPAIPENPPSTTKGPKKVRQECVHDSEIMHNWTQDKGHDEAIFHLNVVHRPASSVRTTTDTQRASVEGHIRWIHSEEGSMTHAKFEDLCSRYAYRHVGSGVRDLTRRLLKRVWATDERDFVGGKFLNPATTRYDGQSKNDDEIPCTFFNFPYFSLEKPHAKTNYEAEVPGTYVEHPIRTLLQSRYRLEATDTRDLEQSITKLSRSEVRTCIRPSPNRYEENVDNKSKPIIHVPQLWCLSLSGDVMVTSGPISEGDLRGSAVLTKDTDVRTPQAGHGPSLVRILLERAGKQQSFLYPTDQCDWWFGLLNKQRQILRSRGDERDTEVKFGEYKFYTCFDSTSQNLVDIYNWHDVLKKEKSEKLDLWMKRKVPDVTVTKDTNDGERTTKWPTDTPGVRSGEPDMPPPGPEASTPSSNRAVLSTTQPESLSPSVSAGTVTASTLERVADTGYIVLDAMFQPFFEWPFLDLEGKLDKRSSEDKVKLWLFRIHGALYSRYGNMIQEQNSRDSGQTEVLASEETVDVMHRKIRPCSYADIYTRLKEPKTKNSQYIATMESLCVEAEKLFRLFIRNKSRPASTRSSGSHSNHPQTDLGKAGAIQAAAQETVELYWGAVDTIILCLTQHEGPRLEMNILLQELRKIISGARELQLGMLSLRSVQDRRHDGHEQNNHTEIKLLLEVIVDVFEAVFGILFETVRYLWAHVSSSPKRSSKISSFIGRHVKESLQLLVDAKARLIVEADEINHDKDLGPVVTPEAIIIMLLERLSHGVYLNGTVDIMDLYERIVEKIALKVEKSASRRLLLEINRVSEELDIINDVLRQQIAVLTPFRESLDPETFKTPSIPRRMKFQYESKSIEKILKAIGESIIDCTELRERASRLAIQNVQLVETQLEDNGKAIIVFTVVTIFFLPPTFVTGFFGMNLGGINASSSKVDHFWIIALPLTFGVVFLCLFAAFSGSIKRWIQRHVKQRKEKRN